MSNELGAIKVNHITVYHLNNPLQKLRDWRNH